MVSFWPWKGDDSSPASFEKALSALSEKIANNNTKLDRLRQRSRRLSLLWTLYSSFAYLLYSIILTLVVGWRSWGIAEYAAVIGGPLLIYAIRFGLLTYYGYRISNLQTSSDELEKQRTTTIEKLKTATKYNSTQELLKKYGGTPSPKGKATSSPKQAIAGAPKSARTNIAPPPTANIPGKSGLNSLPNTPQRPIQEVRNPLQQNVPHSAAAAIAPWQQPSSPQDTSAEFAPNAFSAAPQYAQPGEGPRWYDRLVDALIGEDETSPKNRIALICNQCRLVNGQAPPSAKRLEDVGKWRCGGCGAMNGEESEAKKLVASIERDVVSANQESIERRPAGMADSKEDDSNPPTKADRGHESDVTQYTEDSDSDQDVSENMKRQPTPIAEAESPRRRSTRTKAGGKKG